MGDCFSGQKKYRFGGQVQRSGVKLVPEPAVHANIYIYIYINVTFLGIGLSRDIPLSLKVSMYFGATEKWHVYMVTVSRVVQLAGASDAPLEHASPIAQFVE